MCRESDGPKEDATVTIAHPLAAAPATSSRAAADLPGSGAPRRVLVIEDNVDAAETLRDIFQLHAHVVEVAYSGPDGLAKARAFKPDVVLCDIGLPGMDGYAVARALRAEPAFVHVALVALTGYAEPEDVARAQDAGFDAHLVKPAGIQALLHVVEKPQPDPRRASWVTGRDRREADQGR